MGNLEYLQMGEETCRKVDLLKYLEDIWSQGQMENRIGSEGSYNVPPDALGVGHLQWDQASNI